MRIRRWVSVRQNRCFFLGIFVVLVVLLVSRFWPHSKDGIPTAVGTTMHAAAQKRTDKRRVPPFSLLVTLDFTELPEKERFLRDLMPPLCQYIRHYESNTTLSYQILLSEKDPRQVMVLERYVDKETAYLQIHKSSAPFRSFRAQLQEMQDRGQVTIQGTSYYDAEIGFVLE